MRSPSDRAPAVAPAARQSVVLYDGVCALCNAFTRFALERDAGDALRFASLQSDFARAALARHGHAPEVGDTLYVLAPDGEGETVLTRSRAVAHVLSRLPRAAWCGRVVSAIPRPVADALYALVAAGRYRLFGRLDRCPLPSDAHRGKFLD